MRSRRRDDKTDLGNLHEMLNDCETAQVTEEDKQAARLTVCGYAEDATVARNLLDMLGLLP